MEFRGYDVHPPFGSEFPNLTAAERDDKWSTFLTYSAYDTKICNQDGAPCPPTGGYADYAERQYPFAAGLVVGLGGRCLEVDQARKAGSLVRIGTCVSGSRQTWSVAADGHIGTSDGMCLAIAAGVSTDGAPVSVAPCADVPEQQWTTTSAGQLQLQGGKCLTVHAGASEEGAPVEATTCADDPSARWRPYP